MLAEQRRHPLLMSLGAADVSGSAMPGGSPYWAWRASDESLAPYLGSGTLACTRAGTDAMRMNSSLLYETVAANTARYDYFRCITPDTSGKRNHLFSCGAGLPPAVVGGALAGLQFDGLSAGDGTQALQGGLAASLGVNTSDGSMSFKATIRRGRTGVVEIIGGRWGFGAPTANWLLYIDAAGKLIFGVIDSSPAAVAATSAASLAAATNYEVEGVWDGANIYVKINGVQNGAAVAVSTLQAVSATTAPFYISRDADLTSAGGPYPFQGVVANAEMYKGGVLQGKWAMLTLTPTLLVEPPATNRALRNRDLTNAAWVKGATVAVAKDQVGVTGGANTASKITFGAVQATNTVLQTVLLASSVRVQSAFVKRLVGTGTVEMTTDGGTTWVNITLLLTTAWNRVSIPAQTVTNPSFGFRGATNGDQIAVDLVQNETDVLTSPIITGAAAVTRNIDDVNGAASGVNGFREKPAGFWVQAISGPGLGVGGGNNPCSMAVGTDGNNLATLFREGGTADSKAFVFTTGATQALLTLGTDSGNSISKTMLAYDTNDVSGVKDGGTVETDVLATIPAQSHLMLGNDVIGQEVTAWRGWLVEAQLWGRPTNTFMQQETA